MTHSAIAKLLVAGAACLTVMACEAKVKDPGKLPEVDVSTKAGRLPEVDVETADVNIGKKKVEVPVPDVSVKDKEVTVPDVDVTMPSEKKE